MDSLSQIALGSAVAIGVMGRRAAVWKAATWGAVAGTLPDLDVVFDHGDALLNMVLHRAESHALLYLTLFAPLLGWVAAQLDRSPDRLQRRAAPNGNRSPEGLRAAAPSLPAQAWTARSGVDSGNAAACKASDPRSGGAWGRWTLALWLVLITHPLLDAMTVYGTQLLLPFTNHPYGVGSVFIIDPAYTLPLVVGVVVALRCKGGVRGLRWNTLGLVLSTAYLAWSVFAQGHIDQVARASLRAQGIAAERVLVTPAPLQTLLWRVVALPDDPASPVFHEAYVSVFDGTRPPRWAAHDRGTALLAQHAGVEPVARLTAFTHGFIKAAAMADEQLRITDLRMGQEPDYVFNFDLGPLDAVGSVPTVHHSARPPTGPALRWIGQRMWGRDVPQPWTSAGR